MTQLQKRRLHLPHHSENLLYILALAISPIGNYLLHMLMLDQYQPADRPHHHHLGGVSGAGGKGHQHPARPGNDTLS